MEFKNKFYVACVLTLSLYLQSCSTAEDKVSSSLPNSNEELCQQSSVGDYFSDVLDQAQTLESLEKGIRRERKVTVNIEQLKKDILTGPKKIHLNLFTDKVLDVAVEKITRSADGSNLTLSGHIEGDVLSSAVMVIEKNVLIATLKPHRQNYYKLVYKGNEVHSIQEADSDDGESEEACLSENMLAPPSEDNQDSLAQDAENHVMAIPVIDMLVAYTPNAKTAAGGTDAIVALIKTGIANTNQAFANSGVSLSVRLVGVLAMTQNESGDFSSDLSALQSKTDGKWDSVHAERTRLGADQVTLVGNFSGSSVAGIGYVGASFSSAFTVVKRSAFSQYTFSHELGHNIGLHHEDGYVNSSGEFRTIMAYGSYPRIIRFSNPQISYNGYTTGTSASNSSSILNAKGSTTAAFQVTKVIDDPIDVPIQDPPTDSNCSG